MLNNQHQFNTSVAISTEDVDRINKKFYGRYNFPWYPSFLEKYSSQALWLTALNQELGYFDNSRVVNQPKIWVAGCGTNQAVITALKYPESEVLGTDLSKESLAAARSLAEQLNVTNLRLEERSLNEVCYEEEFDLIICTGVIHHNYDPSMPLRALTKALKQDGILELFVYNYYHRITTTSLQKAIRMLCSTTDNPNTELEHSISERMINDDSANYSDFMSAFINTMRNWNESAMADAILQPVEYSYTVESFDDLVQQCNLEIVAPCLNSWDKAEGRLSWDVKFGDEKVQQQYHTLPDVERWKIGNLLKLEQSPHIWFYVQRKDSSYAAKPIKKICEEFLSTRFTKMSCEYQHFVIQDDNEFIAEETPKSKPHPKFPQDKVAAKVFMKCKGDKTIAQILAELNLSLSQYEINELRLHLTTPAYPYICAV
ncbi:class I SAM-dependent methyltransferase [Pseudoalteromonas luteoviolacea]|uniref:class I SAM-dependent methyltransferase n=1 Tax=Pseudoalteromonas luteoviolacea TaxID=43657 RepID=UPI001F285F1C|nr:class I SAM-dependent methyltransferase [Pseudoalteromonas luteoviolacea]MCF6437882.1 class I SAM-dependent methyltransferase [Pseudoalteromonas luteoviolacea]